MEGLKILSNSGHISHLQFKDDTLLLGPTSLEEAKAISNVNKIFKRPTQTHMPDYLASTDKSNISQECKHVTEEKNPDNAGI